MDYVIFESSHTISWNVPVHSPVVRGGKGDIVDGVLVVPGVVHEGHILPAPAHRDAELVAHYCRL